MKVSWPRPGADMRAIDTNIVVRYLTADHPEQSKVARRLIEHETVFVGVTVILETEWVLRSVYRQTKAKVADRLRAFGGLPNVMIEDAMPVMQALDWMEQGMDFADALHLARCSGCTDFVTFDQALLDAAKGRAPITVCQP